MHIGGVRTALFNWLFARHHGGTFILRIEDTDQKRFDPDALRLITDGLRWVGLDWDEGPEVGGEYGPYIQSERLQQYQHWANWLVDQGQAYRCYCSPERLDALHKQQESGQERRGYDRRCRDLTPEQRDQLHHENGGKYVIRFKMPIEGSTTVHDLLRGDITFDNDQLQDLVLLKTDGYPTYHLANVVDDHFMKISHILRAEEWIPTAPIHKNLYDGFGWEPPHFAHLPVILNPSGKGKLSKRTVGFREGGQQIPVRLDEFEAGGYVPEAIINFLTNIGWSFGDNREVFSVQETIENFDLSRVNPAGGKFPIEKLEWLNGVYIRDMDPVRLAQLLKPILENAGYEVNVDMLLRAIPLIRERIKVLPDVIGIGGLFFADDFTPPARDMLIQKGMDAPRTKTALEESLAALEALPDFNAASQEAVIRPLAEKLGLKMGQLLGTLRAATTAQEVSPPLFETMDVLGREKSLARIRQAMAVVSE
ncbi:MAG: glutamate--tRNA ligase [Chloroflexi bacterium]|nr:glutamate--tRNA ligase [Chloroflexota bacterium]